MIKITFYISTEYIKVAKKIFIQILFVFPHKLVRYLKLNNKIFIYSLYIIPRTIGSKIDVCYIRIKGYFTVSSMHKHLIIDNIVLLILLVIISG